MPRGKGVKKAKTQAGPLETVQGILDATPAILDDPFVASDVPWTQLPEGPLLRVMEFLFLDKDGKAAVCMRTSPGMHHVLLFHLLFCLQFRNAGTVCTTWRQAHLEVLLGDTAASRPER
jgi:hypothetical protein